MTQPSHAGGIVVRLNGGKREYLVVRPRTSQAGWVLPKGHIEAGEAPEAAAVREVAEEAGVRAEIVGTVGTTEYVVAGELVSVLYFLMRYLEDAQRSEDRERTWLAYAEALRSLSHENARNLLTQAQTLPLKGRAVSTRP